jgi:hypothetical protein
MNFQPKTEQEIADSRLWKKGVYDFEIVGAEEKTSATGGNIMIDLKVKLTRPDGAARVITAYVLPKRMETLRNAAAACGLLDRYDGGSLSDADFQGKRGKLKLGIEKGKNGYPDRNIVADWLSAPVNDNTAPGPIRLVG